MMGDPMDRPCQFPDLNPNEHMWIELENRLDGKVVKNVSEKFAQLEEQWHNMPHSCIDQLISMPRQCQAVIDSKCSQQSADLLSFHLC